ncbi:MAG: hypothetical protein QN141_13795 [Armatimonadota bacterium]|nr:hypothetical protein [Armatimonadota bacterium]MDR7559551.1 hypothetical protein [Armatimonadota bacterium]
MAAVFVLVASLVTPVGAQMALRHTFTFRYWGSTFSFGNPPPATYQYNQPGWGFSYRGDARNRPWALTFNYDGLSAPGQFWETATMWNINAHRRLPNIPNGQASVFLGYGSATLSNTVGGQGGTSAGFRLGADARVNLGPSTAGWYVTGEAAWGPSWDNTFAAFPAFANGPTTEYKIALGREFGPNASAQIGWRSFNWSIPTSPGCGTSPGCQLRWSGWTLEVVTRR